MSQGIRMKFLTGAVGSAYLANLRRKDGTELRKKAIQKVFSIILHEGPQKIFSLHARLASAGIKLVSKTLYTYLKGENALFDRGWRTFENKRQEHGYWFINPKVFLKIKAQEINLQNATDIAGKIIYLGKRRNANPLSAAIETLEELLKDEPKNPEFVKCIKAFQIAQEMAQKEIKAKSWYTTIKSRGTGGIQHYFKRLLPAKLEFLTAEINLASQNGIQKERITEVLDEMLFIRQTLKEIEAKGFNVPPKIYEQLGNIENRIFEL